MARERMSAVDMAWLRSDSPGNLFMIVGVWVFDAPIAHDELAARLRESLLAYDRFRQKAVARATAYSWVDDDDFRLERHLVKARLPAPAGDAELRAMVGALASEQLDHAHPLWQFTLVENYGETNALIMRVHHCIADGMALVGVMLSLTDGGPEPDRDAGAEDDGTEAAGDPDPGLDLAGTFLGSMTRYAVRAARVAGSALATSIEVAGSAEGREALANAGARVVGDALKIALMTQDSWTPLKGVPCGRKAVAWNDPLPLSEVKAVCRVLGVSVNDVLLSCVAGALRRYLESVGDHTRGKELRAMVPVNLRSMDEPLSLGNRFGLVPLVLPIGIANPIERLYELRRRMEELKNGYQGPIAYAILNAVGMTPRVVQKALLDYLAHKATAVMTNVPGPGKALRICGRKVSRSMFWVPQSGTVGLGVSILSYDGGVQFGIISDIAVCPEPQRIIDEFAPEFDRLLLTLSMLPRELVQAGMDPAEIERRLFGHGGKSKDEPAASRAAAAVKPRKAGSRSARAARRAAVAAH